MTEQAITVRTLTASDRMHWQPLFEGYARFYQVALTPAIIDQVWQWLCDPEHVFEGLLAFSGSGEALGLAHIRSCPRSLGGSNIGFLDDLFVQPHARGSGVADALMDALHTLAQERQWPMIRWLTQHFNTRGRAFYDRYTDGPSDFIAYQWRIDQ